MRFSELFKNASYITATDTENYPYFRKKFVVSDKIAEAKLTVSILALAKYI